MVFSLFSRKDKSPPEGQKKTNQLASTGSARSGSMRPYASRPHDDPAAARAAAAQTMAKIDAIESEMNLNDPAYAVLRGQDPKGLGSEANKSQSPFVPYPEKNQINQADGQLQASDFATSALLGDTAGAGNLEILGSGYAPVLEEAAILFSNGQATEAASLLQASLDEKSLGPAEQTAWKMLFDVYQALNKQAEFENLSLDYAAKFEASPPAWRGKKVAEPQKLNANFSLVVIPETLDSNVTKIVESIQAATAKGRPVLLEMSKLKTVEPFGAEGLLKTLNAFKKTKRELALAPVEKLVAACRQGVEAGRRDTSDAIWLLLLEGLRLLGKQQEFEDTSIDYCVTFEVSPPSWEAMPVNIRAEANGPSTISETEKLGTRVQDNTFHLVGDLSGSLATELALLTDYASSRRDCRIDCGELRRIEFVAAGQLQNQLTTLRTLGKRIDLINVSIPVGTLFGVVGMADVAHISLRAD